MNTMTTDAAWWSLLWDAGVMSLALLGPDRRYRAVNGAFCRWLVSDRQTLCGWSYERVGHPLDLDRELDAFVRLAAGADAVTYERRYQTADDHELSATVHAIAGADDTVMQVIIPTVTTVPPASDHAALKLEQLAAALSHDALESVRQLSASAGLLLQRLEPLLSTHVREQSVLSQMEKHAQRLASQLRGLARFARLGSPQFNATSQPLRSLIAAACVQVAVPTTIRVHDTVAADVVVHCDTEQLTTALSEIIRNACAPHLSSRPTTITISAMVAAGRCVISIADDGDGIAASDQPRLFRLFAARSPGTGIGLALVRAITTSHGGEVSLESTQGVGTVVRLSLPQ